MLPSPAPRRKLVLVAIPSYSGNPDANGSARLPKLSRPLARSRNPLPRMRRGACLNAVTLDELVQRITPDVKTAYGGTAVGNRGLSGHGPPLQSLFL